MLSRTMIVMTIILTRLMANSFGFGSNQFARAVCHTFCPRSQFTKSAHPPYLEEPQRVCNPQPAPHLRRKLFDERQVITIQRVAHIEKVKRDDMRRVAMGEQVRA